MAATFTARPRDIPRTRGIRPSESILFHPRASRASTSPVDSPPDPQTRRTPPLRPFPPFRPQPRERTQAPPPRPDAMPPRGATDAEVPTRDDHRRVHDEYHDDELEYDEDEDEVDRDAGLRSRAARGRRAGLRRRTPSGRFRVPPPRAPRGVKRPGRDGRSIVRPARVRRRANTVRATLGVRSGVSKASAARDARRRVVQSVRRRFREPSVGSGAARGDDEGFGSVRTRARRWGEKRRDGRVGVVGWRRRGDARGFVSRALARMRRDETDDDGEGGERARAALFDEGETEDAPRPASRALAAADEVTVAAALRAHAWAMGSALSAAGRCLGSARRGSSRWRVAPGRRWTRTRRRRSDPPREG